MFTGIVESIGTISHVTARGGDIELAVIAPQLDLTRTKLGDSVSVQGACLTVTRLDGQVFFADVSAETLAKTTLGALLVGASVNLEPALRAGDALGGHLVSGHIDTVGQMVESHADARSRRLMFALPEAFARFVAPKGSICIDGVSLTINEVNGRVFGVNIIPHTCAVTTLGRLKIGDAVNVEVDLIARYLDRLIAVGPRSGC
jgi:riboflavin synthase